MTRRAGSTGMFASVAKFSELCKMERLDEALHEVYLMSEQRLPISRDIFCCLLRGCTRNKDLEVGRRVHSLLVKNGLDSVALLQDDLACMLASCGSSLDADLEFCKVANPCVQTWYAIISVHVTFGENQRALQLYNQMQGNGIETPKIIYLCILKTCDSDKALGQGKLIHAHIIRSGFESDVFIGSTLIDMYSKFGSLEDAHKLFDQLPNRNVVSWNAMMAGYVKHGHGLCALKLFTEMQQEGLLPGKFTFSCILKACNSVGDLSQGKLIHTQIIKHGLESDMFVGSTLVDMYAKCGSLSEAQKMFNKLQKRDLVSWNVMIAGYANYGHGPPALELFEKMQAMGIKPGKFTFSCILKACGSVISLERGKLIHGQIIRCGLDLDDVIGNALVDMYAKCGNLEEARKVFDNLTNLDLVSLNAMLAGYAQYGHGLSALEVFGKLQGKGMNPDQVTFSCILKACGSIGAIGQGKLIHNWIIKNGFESNVILGNTLIDMYAKCGSLDDALDALCKLANPNLMSWSSLIAGYASHANYKFTIQIFEEMQQQGIKPDGRIYTSILTACSHMGKVEKGHHYFESMIEKHGIKARIEHFNCMLDILGRAGCLKEAEEFLRSMPIPADSTSWRCLLTACRTYGNMGLGKKCFDEIAQLSPDIAAGYMLVSDIYANGQLWEDVNKIQDLRKCAGAWKKPGRSWLEISDRVHEFIVSDTAHHSDKTHLKVKRLSKVIEEEGYLPQLDLVLELPSDCEKEVVLCGQPEEQVMADGVLIPSEASLRHNVEAFFLGALP